MKRFGAALLSVCALLAGCQSQNSVPAETSAETKIETTSAAEQTAEADGADAPVPNGGLTDDEQQILSEFLPILTEGKTFTAAHMPRSGESAEPLEEKSLADIIHDIDPEYTSDKAVQSIAFCDVTGDGRTDVAVLLDHPAGFYCLLCTDGDNFYGVHMPIRWFEDLRENGVFMGSGGAATAYYERLHFSDGVFSTELLGYTDMGYYEADGKEVSQEEFETWLDGTLSEKVIWHDTWE